MHDTKETLAETTKAEDTTDTNSSIEHKDGSETEKNLSTPDQSSEDEKLTGVKLLVLGFALCFMVFLIAMNGTVVATVGKGFQIQVNFECG